jgi:hypothetical protein
VLYKRVFIVGTDSHITEVDKSHVLPFASRRTRKSGGVIQSK